MSGWHISIRAIESWPVASRPRPVPSANEPRVSTADSTATGEIPGQTSGTVVLYYFEGGDDSGGGRTIPGRQ